MGGRFLRPITLFFALSLFLVACTDGQSGAPSDEAGADQGCQSVDLASPPDEPTTIRIAHGVAAEEPFWLMTEHPEITEYQGQWYDIDRRQFRGGEEQLTAYQSGDVDATVVNPFQLTRGTATGALDLVPLVTIMRDGEPDAFSTTMLTLDDSGVESLEDLQGKTIVINDPGSLLEFLTRAALVEVGYDYEQDVTVVIAPFPAMEDALREGQADVAIVPEPFYTLAHSRGGIHDLADSNTLVGFGFDLLVMGFDRTFVEDNLGAVCAWREDYKSALAFYQENLEEARRILAATDLIPLPADVYLQTGDYARPDDGVVDSEGLRRFIERGIELGILSDEEQIEPQQLVIPGVSSGH